MSVLVLDDVLVFAFVEVSVLVLDDVSVFVLIDVSLEIVDVSSVFKSCFPFFISNFKKFNILKFLCCLIKIK